MAFSQAEHDYCAQAIQQGIRLDGRGPKDFRPIELELGLIAQASGSARLHLGSTDVIVGVKVEVGQPEATKPECGRLQVTVECSPTASPDYEGRGGDAWGLQLAAALESSLCPPGAQKGCGVPLESLNIISGKTCWVVYVDALVLNDDGNVLGALGMACWAALANTRIPHVELVAGEGDEEPELELDDDMDNAMQLDVSGIPVMVSVSQVGHASVMDLILQEEACASATMHVAVDAKSRVCGATKEGLAGIDPSMATAMLEAAQTMGPILLSKLDAYIAATAAKAVAS